MPRFSKKSSSRAIPFAKGFKKPGKTERNRALGVLKNDKEKKFFEFSTGGFYKDIPRPSSDNDWLAQYAEEGQSFSQFKRENPWLTTRKVGRYLGNFVKTGTNLTEKYTEGQIYLVVIEDVSQPSLEAAPDYSKLCEFSSAYLGLPVRQLPPIRLRRADNQVTVEGHPRLRLEFRQHGEKFQLRCHSVLAHLRTKLPPNGLCLVAVTMVDLYEDNTDLFVAGLARGNHRVAVFSFARYDPALTFDPEFWHASQVDQSISTVTDRTGAVQERSIKILVHELCHLLGLDHCIYFSCLMNGSGHLEEDFRQPMHLCPVCLRKLQNLVGFDVVARFNTLLKYYKDNGMTDEAVWCERRLKFISTL